MSRKIVVLAGEFVHRTTTQFRWLSSLAPKDYSFALYEEASALEHLEEADLFIAAGLYWTGSPKVTWTDPVPYVTPNEQQRAGLRNHVLRGKPVMGFHGGIASFDDWPEFGQLLGFAWHWNITTHGPYQEYLISPTGSNHPVAANLTEFQTQDENYYNLQIQLGAVYTTHLKMNCGSTQQPMLMTLDKHPLGGGKAAYLGLGHDQRSIEPPGFQKAFWNTLAWLID